MQADDEIEAGEDEDMSGAERELADDAQWKVIQKNTFSRWANEHLKTVNKNLSDLESDFSDGLRLIALVEVLSGKKFKGINKRPTFRTQKLENVTLALTFLERDEGIRIVNIDSSDIVDRKLKLILGLIWTLILHYSISMPMWEGEEPTPKESTPKQRLLKWIQSKVPDLPIQNFTTDWNDGRAIGALVDAVGPGLCPDWEDWNTKKPKDNAKEAMSQAEKWLDVPQLIRPEDMINPKVDDLSMMTYLSQFPKGKLKPGAPLRPRLNVTRVRAYGRGIEPTGNQVGAPARFTVETFSAGKGEVEVIILNPKGKQESCEVVFNNDRNLTYSCVYYPSMEGQYKIILKFATQELSKSPYTVGVEGAAGDASKVTAKGPGIERSGVIVSKRTFFEVFTTGAGKGMIDVVILDPHGHKDSVKPGITAKDNGVFNVEYIPRESGLHSVNVFFAGHAIPNSPFGVGVSPAFNATAVYATGRGIQPRGIRVKDIADFKVHTEGAGQADLKVFITAPNGKEEKVKMTQLDAETCECFYSPTIVGTYTITITYGDQPIQKSPYKVEVGRYIESKIRAYGPGLEGGVAHQPAVFTVETNGETGALGFSIEGPSQAKIDCKDNGDGSAEVTYWPVVAGEYAVHILCNDEDIPKSPYMANILTSVDYDASKVTAKGPGLEKTGVIINKWAEFLIDTRKAGGTKAPVFVSCMDIDYNPVDVQVKDNKDGTYSCKYMAKKNVKHTIQVAYGGVSIPNSPFRVYVAEPSQPNKVKVTGPGVEKGVKTNQKTYFIVDCKTAGAGDVAVALTDGRGTDVPLNVIDNKDSTFKVEYNPVSVGTYNVSVFFADKQVPQSPIKVNVESSIDLSKVRVEGLEPKMLMGKEHEIDIITSGAGEAEAKVLITNPAGVTSQLPTQPTIDGHAAKFAFLEPGPHKVDVLYGDMPVSKSPFVVEAVPEGATKVKAHGPGLAGGQSNKPAEFIIDTREAGPGALGVTVEGPVEAKIECEDNRDGTCNVTYYPTVPGDYNVNITYSEEHIPGSPFIAKVVPGVDLSGVTVIGPGVGPEEVYLTSPTEFKVDAKSVAPAGEGKIRAIVTSPTNKKTEAIVKNNNDGTYDCSYTPVEQGKYSIDVTYDSMPIPKTPFTVQAVPGFDATRCKAYGPGLEGGFTNAPAQFTVETRGAGQGGLGLSIEGPVETKMTCKDNRDGTCLVEYHPLKPGDYSVGVKFADQDIPGSPFPVHITTPVDAKKVKCHGPGLDTKGVRSGVPATFTVDASEAGDAPLSVVYTDQAGKKHPADLVPVSEGVCQATYVPKEEGKGKVDVTYGGQAVPNSPWNMRVLPGHDASKVKVTGPGVKPQGTVASMPTTFNIDTREAGIADTEVMIQRPDGSLIRPNIADTGDGIYNVTYTPEDVGRYPVRVKYGGKDVPGSPFQVSVKPTGDASKCKITEGLEETVIVNKQTVISVDATQAGIGKVTCRISSPDGTDIDIDIVDNGDGSFCILFTPQFPGTYSINIKFGGQSVPHGNYTVQAVTLEEYELLMQQEVGEDMIVPDTAGGVQAAPAGLIHPVDFRIPVGPIFNFVSANIISPTGKKSYPKIEDNKDGTVTVRYQPTEVGLHELNVHYNNQPINGSPFQFHVNEVDSGFVTAYGPGLTHGTVNEPAEFTVITKDARAGGLALAVEGPSKAEITCRDNQDGTCTVNYLPTAPGEYKVVVKFADKHISGSPFTTKVNPGDSRKRAQLSVGSSSEVSLKVTETDIANLTASIRSPSGREEPCILKRLPNGHLGISFTPREVGEHLVNVYRNGKHIANSPFKIFVGEGELGNASKVKATGRGLKEGMANEVNQFNVNTKEAGYGGLSLSIEGPSKADIECHDQDDGSCNVTYKPTEPGTYIINIKFADEHVPGSPYAVKIGGEPSSRVTEKITRHREAADITQIGSTCELSLKIPGTSPYDMQAAVTSPSGVTELCDVNSLDDSHYSIKFVPKEMGIHTVSVKHKGMHIPGSPFEFTVGPLAGGGAHKVRAGGPGLEKGEVNSPCEFQIYTREAGAGGLAIAVEGPSKAEIDFDDRKDGSCGVNYICTEPGEYLVSVKFNDEHIPDSPFRVQITPSVGDARKLTMKALQETGLQVGKPAAFNVDFNGAKGNLTARVVSPSGCEDEALIQEIDDGNYAVRFIPRENGIHMVHVTFDNCHIPGSPFRLLVGHLDADAGKVTAHGDGLKHGRTGQVAKFIVNTVNAGAGALAITVEGPSKVKLDCKEVSEGYEFTYTPTAPGDYLITIRYAGINIAGSPFKARIEGQGRASGLHEHASVVVETVTKTSTTTTFTGIKKFSSDATKVVPQGEGLKRAVHGKATTFQVDVSQAGNNILYVGMMGPTCPCEELIIKHVKQFVYSVTYHVKDIGQYMLVVRWGNQDIAGSPFCVEVV